ncbi:hypothetical protein ACHAWF_015089 [Thalassiosira exigua]
MPSPSHGDGDAKDRGHSMEENRDDEEYRAKAALLPPDNVDKTEPPMPMQLCFLDSKGNKMNISSMEQLKVAVSFLESERKNRDPMFAYSTDDAMIGHDQPHSDEDDHPHNFSTRTNTTQQAFLDEVKRFELFRSVIQHEDDLLNQRVSWIILAQSFLMAAFITNTSDDGGGDALKFITAIVGLMTVVVTMPAIWAAGRNIELQQKVYFARISSEERCLELHGHGRNRLKCDGDKINLREEQEERLRSGHIFPNMSFRGRGSVPILFTVVGLAAVQVLGWCFLLVALVKRW